MEQFTRDGLTFDVVDRGPLAAAATVVLLHGWPADASMWDGVAQRLSDAGLRTLAPDQRGYSPGARPAGRAAYALPELVEDVVALADAAGLDRFHLVGHDWGGAVAWSLAATHPDRLASLTVLSTPHPKAVQRSLLGAQLFRSAYMAFFQVPRVPEAVLLARDAAVGRALLRRSGLSEEVAARYMARLAAPGALSASLAWYRALLARRPTVDMSAPISVPTTYAWSTGDTALGRRAAELTAEHVAGPYRFEVLAGVSHWIPEEVPDVAADLIREQVAAVN
ncbi:MAG: alpha/beta fold hydrolase [Acidimicrobiales bacterium]|nr:alpha/beta fold hydrolase [Acidimicrobiales bacterium]